MDFMKIMLANVKNVTITVKLVICNNNYNVSRVWMLTCILI